MRWFEELRSYPVQYAAALALLGSVGVLLVVVSRAPVSHAPHKAPVHLTARQRAFEDAFVSGCVGPQTSESMCRCMATELVERDGLHTNADMLRLQVGVTRAEQTGSLGDVPVELRTAATNCR